MNRTLTKAAKRASAVVAVGAVLVGGAGVAFAATPPYEPDTTNQLGTILFYDAAGNQVTSGNVNDDPFSKYAVASTDDPIATNTKATLYGYLPVNGVAPGGWSGEPLSASTTFPVASPAYIAGAGAHRPVVTNNTGDATLAGLMADFPHPAGDTGTAYDGLYQLRIKTAGNTKWWAADIQVVGSTWTLVYPSLTSTSSGLSFSPASPQTLPSQGAAPSSVTLTDTLSAGANGTVQFFRNGVALGSPVAVAGGVASTTDTPAGPAAGASPVTTAYSATFTPAAGAAFTPATANASYVVQNAAVPATSTSLSVNTGTGFSGDPVTFTSSVTSGSGTPAGTVSWYDNGSATPLNAAPVTLSGSPASASFTTTFATAASHSIVAKFTPADPAAFAASQSAPSTFTQQAQTPVCTTPRQDGLPGNSSCRDDATFDVTVNAGTLTIATPYTPTSPFHLGTMALSPQGTYLHASAPFGTAAAPANGVTITDTRAGNPQWTASVQAADFTAGSNAINAANLGFINLAPSYIAGNAQQNVAVTNNPSPVTVNAAGTPSGIEPANGTSSLGLRGTPHQFATAPLGNGTVYVIGTMDLYAPTSTPAGTYTSVVTFTIA